MSNSQFTAYTLFWDDGYQPNDEPEHESLTLQQFIDACTKEYGPPIAWMHGYCSYLVYERDRAHAIVAGRLIQYDEASGKYIPLGVSPTPTLDKMEAEKRGSTQEAGIADLAKRIQEHRSAERHRAPLDWNKPTPFDPFKGFTVTSHCANEPKACGLHSPDLKQSSHQVAAVFGSAELVRR